MIKKIDDSAVQQFNNKVIPELEYRKKILNFAKKYGCHIEVQQIMNKYDKILNQCTNPKEKEQIGIMGVAEIHKLMGCYGSLIVNGNLIIPAQDLEKEQQNIIYTNFNEESHASIKN